MVLTGEERMLAFNTAIDMYSECRERRKGADDVVISKCASDLAKGAVVFARGFHEQPKLEEMANEVERFVLKPKIPK